MQLTAVIEREEEGYVATCPELDVVSQGDTVEEARSNLLEAVEGFFEAAAPFEVRRRLKVEMNSGLTQNAGRVGRRIEIHRAVSRPVLRKSWN